MFAALVMLVAAQEPTLAVVPLDGLGVDAELLHRLDSAVLSQVDRLKIPVVGVPTDQNCSGDLKCLVGLGTEVRAARVVAGSVGLAGDELHVTLKVIDVGLQMELKTLDDAAPAAQAERRVRSVTMRLLAPDLYNESGALLVNFALAGADIVVDGAVRASTPLFGPVDHLTPGRRSVEVRYVGMNPWRGFVDVPFDEVYQLDLAVKDASIVEIPHGAVAPPAASTATKTGDGAIPVVTIAGIAVAGAGVIAIVAATFAFASAEDAFVRVHDEGDTSSELIAQNRNASTAYGILLPTGIVLTAGGAGLALFSLVE